VYPALSVAKAIRRYYPDITLTFVGARGDVARDLVAQSDVKFDSYHEVLAGPLHGVSLLRKASSTLKIIAGFIQSLLLVLQLRPQVLFLTGGWVGFPLAVACWILRRPIVIYVPDIEPGLALRVLGRRFAKVIAATVADTEQFYPGKRVVATGYPLRERLLEINRADAIRTLGLDPAKKTLLAWGGSKGARTINTTISRIAPDLLREGIQILHIAGRLDWPQVQTRHAALTPEQQANYNVYEYMSDIGLTFAAADLVIGRAGASTLAEYPLFGLPSIQVPYPFAWRYQKVNADYLVERGAAIRLDDERMETELLPLIRDLFHDPARLDTMRAAALSLREPNGAENIARLIVDTGTKK
jgi:UDP-N-acetylglucosamine--N-acetylmuramyl-(pentapeptide) pyrophosphoryl-undecaprenol N-acetylglucosamine transferase